MLWLRRFDPAAKVVPKGLLRRMRLPADIQPLPCLLRPGGLGDLVILTRAVIELGLSPLRLSWLVERRNAPWLQYLGVDYLCYDEPDTFLFCLAGLQRHGLVINTEQTFGLSALLASRITAAPGGRLTGFSSNRRSDCYEVNIEYECDTIELECFKRLLTEAGLTPQPGSSSSGYRLPAVREGQGGSPHAVVAIAGLEHGYKRLSLQQWCELVERAAAECPLVYLVGAPRDREFAVQLQGSCGVEVRNVVGVAPFPRTVDLVRTAKLVVSVDSGLVHVADFFSIPSEAVFKGGNPRKWRPLTPGSRVLDGQLRVRTDY